MSIRVKCNIFITGFLLSGITFLSGCFPEGTKGCPEEMLVSFSLEDSYDEGDFDSRIGNNVHLGIFIGQELFNIYEIPYEMIKNGNQFIIDKADGIEGYVDLVAWSISKNLDENEYTPQWEGDKTLGNMSLGLRPISKSETKYNPVTIHHFIGSLSTREYIDQQSIHEISMNVTTCRVEVNIKDPGQSLNSANEVYVEVNGTLENITMERIGTGSPAIIVAGLTPIEEDNTILSTGRFGVYPSGENQTVSIDIISDEVVIKTLTVPQENLPRGAESGGLLVFEYTLGEAHYFLTIDGFTIKIVDIDDL